MKPRFIFLLTLLISSTLPAQTITVKQDSTGDFTTIQAAVDSAQNGDTVLVWPGTYYENIEIISKSITLGSLTLTTGDENYKYQTIVDGNSSGSCIDIEYNDSLTIDGFTFQNGTGNDNGYIDGGGIFAIASNNHFYNCIIKQNKVTGYGGGMYLFYSNTFLSNITIIQKRFDFFKPPFVFRIT